MQAHWNLIRKVHTFSSWQPFVNVWLKPSKNSLGLMHIQIIQESQRKAGRLDLKVSFHLLFGSMG
jgi:hypothetical protein